MRLMMAWLFSACVLMSASQADEMAYEPEVLQQGAALLAPFKQSLKAALQEGMADGPEAAMNVCRVKAPAIAAALSGPHVKIGRSSERLRNPVNAPSPWMQDMLSYYRQHPVDRQSRYVALDSNRIGYAEPITVQPMCLMCHGSKLAPSVSQALAALYPNDQATGYQAGDLRGIFWVEFEPSVARVLNGVE